jgi:heme-degrading monooxygenase HmoA
MATSTISAEQAGVVFINVFTVAPEYQQKLIEMIEDATEEVMQHIPGFISANIHKSLDGTKIINYAQWESKEAFLAMLQNPQATAHRHEIRALASPEGAMYEVTRVMRSSKS